MDGQQDGEFWAQEAVSGWTSLRGGGREAARALVEYQSDEDE